MKYLIKILLTISLFILTGCSEIHNWNTLVPYLLEETTRIEFISGFASDSELFLTVTDSEKVAEFVTNLEFDPKKRDVSTFCPCIADMHLKFYNSNNLITTFEIACEDHVRWKYGKPTVISLTLKSGDFLANWLSDYGVDYILKKREETKEKNRKASEKLKNQFYELLEILPTDISEKLRKNYEAKKEIRSQTEKELSSDIALMNNQQQIYDDIEVIISSHYKDKEELAKVSLTALSNFNRKNFLSYIFSKYLNEIDSSVLQKAIEQLLEKKSVTKGVCRWFFGMSGYKNLDNNFIEKYLEEITLTAFEDSREREDRLHIIHSLGRIDTDSSRKILREILNGGVFDKLSPTGDNPWKEYLCSCDSA